MKRLLLGAVILASCGVAVLVGLAVREHWLRRPRLHGAVVLTRDDVRRLCKEWPKSCPGSLTLSTALITVDHFELTEISPNSTKQGLRVALKGTFQLSGASTGVSVEVLPAWRESGGQIHYGAPISLIARDGTVPVSGTVVVPLQSSSNAILVFLAVRIESKEWVSQPASVGVAAAPPLPRAGPPPPRAGAPPPQAAPPPPRGAPPPSQAPPSSMGGGELPPWEALEPSLFALMYSNKTEEGTGFAVTDSFLATAAHVANHFRSEATGVALNKDGVACSFNKDDIIISPDYSENHSDNVEAQFGPDIALIHVHCAEKLKPVVLAPAQDLGQLSVSKPIAAYGFPTLGFMGGANKPAPFLSQGIVSGHVGRLVFLHNCLSAPGSSGSPLFSWENQRVVGIAEGGDAVWVRDSNGQLQRWSGPGFNFAVNAITLTKLMQSKGLL